MLLSDLLDLPVRCRGERVGTVIDARFALAEGQSAEGQSGGTPQAELVGLIVGRRRGAAFLGYERASTNRPALINRYFAWRQRGSFLVDWSQVSRVDARSGEVELRPGFERRSSQL